MPPAARAAPTDAEQAPAGPVATRAVDDHDLTNASAIYDFVSLYIQWAKRHPNEIMMPVGTTADAVTLPHQGTVRHVPSGSKFNEIIGALTPDNNIIALNVTEMYKDVHTIATSFLTQASCEWPHRSDTAVFDVTREFAFPWARRYELLVMLFPSVDAIAKELVHFPQVINAPTAVLARVPLADRDQVTVLTAGQLLDLLTRNLQTTIAIEYTSSLLLRKQQPEKPHAKAARIAVGASPASSADPRAKQFVAHALQPSGTFTTFIDASLPGNGKTMMNVLHVTHALATQERRLAAMLKMQEKGAVTVFYPVFYPIVIIATGSASSQFREAVQQMAPAIKEQYDIVVKVADATKGFSLKKYKSQSVGQALHTLTFAIICQENLVLDVLMAQPDGVTLPPVIASSSRRQVAVGEILFGGILVDEGVDMGRRILRHATNQALYTGWILATPKQMFSKHSAALAENLLLRENGKLFAPDRLLQNFKQKNWDEITGPLSSLTELVSMILPLAADHMKLKELCPLRPAQLLISAVATGVIDTLQRCFNSGAQISYQRPGVAALLREMCQQHAARAEPALELLKKICTPNGHSVLLHLEYGKMTSIMDAECSGNVINECLLEPMTWSGLREPNKSIQRRQSQTTPSCWIEMSACPQEWRDLPLVTLHDAKRPKTFVAVAVWHHDANNVVIVPLKKTNDPSRSAAQYSQITSTPALKLGHDLVHVSDPIISTLSQLPLMEKLYKTVTGRLCTQCAFCGSRAEAFTVCCGVCCCTACTFNTSCMSPIANPHPESSERWVESGCKMCLPARFSSLTVSESDDQRLALHYSQSKCAKLLEATNRLRGKPIPATLYDMVCKLSEHGFRRVLVVTPEPDREDSLNSYMREACEAFNCLSRNNSIDFCPAPNGAAAEAIRQRTQILKKFQVAQTYDDDTVVISTYKGASSLVQGADLFTADALIIISGNGPKDMFKDGVSAFTEAAMQAITRVTRPNVLRKSLPEKQYLPCLLLGFERQLNASFFNRGESIPHVMAVRVNEQPNGEAAGSDSGSSSGHL